MVKRPFRQQNKDGTAARKSPKSDMSDNTCNTTSIPRFGFFLFWLILGFAHLLYTDYYDYWEWLAQANKLYSFGGGGCARTNHTTTHNNAATNSSSSSSRSNGTKHNSINSSRMKQGAKRMEDSEEGESYPEEGSLDYYIAMSKRSGDDREHLLKVLRDHADQGADMKLTPQQYTDLPTWKQVTSLYGDQPLLLGAEPDQCQAFRDTASTSGRKKILSVAGMFGTGTSLLANALLTNCAIPDDDDHDDGKISRPGQGMEWQVPNGKHEPPLSTSLSTSSDSSTGGFLTHNNPHTNQQQLILPVVMIRDPFPWMISLCSQYYSAHWPKFYKPDTPDKYHCPSLWPTATEYREKFVRFNTGKPPAQQRGPIRDGQFPKGNQGLNAVADPQYGTYPLLLGNPLPEVTLLLPEEGSNNNTTTILLTDEELHYHFFPVHVAYAKFKRFYNSKVALWNDWYADWYYNNNQNNNTSTINTNTNVARIFLRMEDLIFHPQQVIQQVCECAGGQIVHPNNTVQIRSTSAKPDHYDDDDDNNNTTGEDPSAGHGYLQSLIKYGNPNHRFKGFTSLDLQYASHHLNKDMLTAFHYNLPPQPQKP